MEEISAPSAIPKPTVIVSVVYDGAKSMAPRNW